MKKGSAKFIALCAATLIAVLPLAACGRNDENCTSHIDTDKNGKCDVCETQLDVGELSVGDVLGLEVGKTKNLVPVFTNEAYASTPEYTYTGDAISIENNKVKALKAGASVEVTATTALHSAKFSVTTVEAENIVKLSTVKAYVGYAASPFALDIENDEDVTYTYNANGLEIEEAAKTVKALKIGKFSVEAKTDKATYTFTVDCTKIDRTALSAKDADVNYLKTDRLSDWNSRGQDGKTTLFMGDSFFDLRNSYWQNFYTDLAGKNVVNAGVMGTVTYGWEGKFFDEYLSKVSPKNLVINLGTNNIGNGQKGEEAAEYIQRMMLFFHSQDNLKDTPIYWFSISHRWDNDVLNAKIDKCNALMKEWCNLSDWVTYVDISEQMTVQQLEVDKLHPKDVAYKNIFLPALETAGLVY